MNQKEYELIISVFDEQSCELMAANLYESLVKAFANKLDKYPSFDRDKFLKRLGINQPTEGK